MTESKLISIEPGDLVAQVMQLKHDGYRLAQICAVRTKEGYELSYSFGKEYELVNLRLVIGEDTEVMSISHIFEPAFLYENEMVDLFGVKINLISLDYKGKLYRIEKETPFK
jgi:ech hydrogenase subunit D